MLQLSVEAIFYIGAVCGFGFGALVASLLAIAAFRILSHRVDDGGSDEDAIEEQPAPPSHPNKLPAPHIPRFSLN